MIKSISIYLIIFCSGCFIYAQNWEQVGFGGTSGVKCLFADTLNNKLFAGGKLRAPNGIDTLKGVAQWNGAQWDSLGSGIISAYDIEAITLYNGYIVVGGSFQEAGGISAKGIAKWDGIAWDSVGTHANCDIFDFLFYQDTLYAVGFISWDGGSSATTVAKFNGINWESLGNPPPTGSSNFIRSIEVYNGEIYIAGSIESLQNDSIRNILRWDEYGWQTVGAGVPDAYFDIPVNALQIYQNKLYIGGNMQGGLWNEYDYFGIVSWDGFGYTLPGGIINGEVKDMAVFQDTLYAVGSFNYAGGVSANCIAKWDGTNWCSLGSIFNGEIRAIEVFNDELYIGGGFTTIDGNPIKNVAKWIGGSYTESCGNTTGIDDEMIENFNIYPNPTYEFTTISAIGFGNLFSYSVSNIFGDIIASENFCKESVDIDLRVIPAGIYFVTIKYGDKSISKKIVKAN